VPGVSQREARKPLDERADRDLPFDGPIDWIFAS